MKWNVIDLTGKVFSNLTVLRRGENCGTNVGWVCKCACGKERTVNSSHLRIGKSRTCGMPPCTNSHKLKDLTGQTFGKLTVVCRGNNVGERVGWMCVCLCGRKKTVSAYSLTGKLTKTCGSRICQWGTKEEREKRKKETYRRSQRKWCIKKLYGLSWEDYQHMLKEQEGRCAICGRTMDTINVDHDHRTENTRGLLCLFCNHLLGNAKDDIEILKKAIRYLRRHSG
jgi:hypothetical protein